MVKEIRVNATKIEFEDDELGATRTLKQLSDGTYVTELSSGWTAYVPTIFGNTGSIGTFTASPYLGRYKIIGNICYLRIRATITNIGSWGGNLYITPPITPVATLNEGFLGGYIAASLANPMTANKGAFVVTAVAIMALNSVGSTYLGWAGIAVNDEININGFYEV